MRCTRPTFQLFFSISLAVAVIAPALADDAAFFQQNCATCHTIGGGRLTGPDLKNVSARRDRAWLTTWLQNPKSVVDSGDPYAKKIVDESSGIVMPAIGGMTAAQASTLLDLIDAESKLPRSLFAGTQVSSLPFTPADVALGRQIFTGAHRLQNGGPPCISCHTMRGVGGLGGGRLGPDLTLVSERLQGRKGLTAWLSNPASPTMNPVFAARALQPDEIVALTALFDSAARSGGQADNSTALAFVLLGVGGGVLGMASLDAVWKKRLRGVRRALLSRSRGEE